MPSALNRPIVLAYNHVAASGDDAAFQIGQYDFQKADDGRVTLRYEVLVAGTSATDLQSKLDAFDAIRGEDGALVVQLGRELEKSDLVADGTTTVTSATGGFLTAHEGLWLSIRGIGTRRIVTRNSATSVTLNASVAGGTYLAFLAAKHFAGTHAAFTFVGGRCSTSKPQNREENTEFSQVVSVTVTGQAPVKAPLRNLNVSVTWDASRRRTARLRGDFAPYDYDGDGDVDSAKAVHDYYVGTLVTNHLSAFGGESAYELINETQSYDAPEDVASFASSAIPAKTYHFERTYQERFVADAVGVIDQSCPVVVTANGTHGFKAGLTGKVTASVNYRAAIDHDLVTHTGLAAYYVSTIRPLIIAEIKRQAETTRVVVQAEVPVFDPSGNTITASWSVYLPAKSSTILTYSRTESFSDDPGERMTRLWDGVPFTYAVAKVGAEETRTVRIDVTSQRPVKFSAAGELTIDDSGGGGVTGVVAHGGSFGGGVGVSGGALDAGAVGGATASYPGEGGGGGGAPAWKQQGGTERSFDDVFVGATPFGGGTDTARIYTASATRRYVKAVPSAPVVPAFTGKEPSLPITGAESGLA